MSWVVAFSGSRTFSDRLVIEAAVRRAVQRGARRIVVGDAPGADDLVAREATRWGIWPQVEVCHWPPDPSTKQQRWQAAHERNGRVIAEAEMLVAFYSAGPKSSGTTDAITQAKARGIPVHIFHEGTWQSLPPFKGTPDER